MISDESWYFVIVLCYGPFLFLVRHYLFSYNEWNKWIQIDDASKILFAWKGRKFLKLNDKKATWSFIDRTIRSSWQYWTYWAFDPSHLQTLQDLYELAFMICIIMILFLQNLWSTYYISLHNQNITFLQR